MLKVIDPSIATLAIPSFSCSPAAPAAASAEASSSHNTLRKRKQRKQRDLESCCSKFIDHGWTLALQQFYPEPTTFNWSVPRQHNLLELFFCFLPQSIWDILVVAANRDLVKGQLSSCRIAESHRTAITTEELVHFYSYQILLENTRGNEHKNVTLTFQGVEEEIWQVPPFGY